MKLMTICIATLMTMVCLCVIVSAGTTIEMLVNNKESVDLLFNRRRFRREIQ